MNGWVGEESRGSGTSRAKKSTKQTQGYSAVCTHPVQLQMWMSACPPSCNRRERRCASARPNPCSSHVGRGTEPTVQEKPRSNPNWLFNGVFSRATLHLIWVEDTLGAELRACWAVSSLARGYEALHPWSDARRDEGNTRTKQGWHVKTAVTASITAQQEGCQLHH